MNFFLLFFLKQHGALFYYVVLSRVRKLAGLMLNIPLDAKKDYSPKPELTRWEQDIRQRIEKPLFEQRQELQEYLLDESKYA